MVALGCNKILKDAQMRLLRRLRLGYPVDFFSDCRGVSNHEAFTVGN